VVNTWSWRDAYRIHSSSGGTSESCSNWARVRLLFFERNEVHSSALLKHENAFYRVKKRDPFEGLWLSLCELFGIKTSSIFGAFLGGNGAVCRSSHDFELYNLYAHRRDAGVKGTYSSPAKADAYRHWTKVGILSVSCGHPHLSMKLLPILRLSTCSLGVFIRPRDPRRSQARPTIHLIKPS